MATECSDEQASPTRAPPSPFEEAMGALRAGLRDKCEEFEDRSEAAVRARLRAQVGEKTSKREVDRFLALMRERGNGSIAVAWRRYFDSDGDVIRLWHDLANPESPNALALKDSD